MPLYVHCIRVWTAMESEVICFWLVSSEDKEIVHGLMDNFKCHNSHQQSTKVVMADKDLVEREVMAEKLPGACLQICLFHVLHSFRWEVTVDKMKISVGKSILSLNILGKLAYAKSEAQYNEMHNHMVQTVPRSGQEYFDLNWHLLYQEWVNGLNCRTSRDLQLSGLQGSFQRSEKALCWWKAVCNFT